MPRMEDPAVGALRALLDREGGAQVVGNVIGANWRSLYQIVSGRKLRSGRTKGVGRELREKLERHYPGWLIMSLPGTAENPGQYISTGQTITPVSPVVAHSVRQPHQRLTPPKVSWEAVVTIALPQEFETELPDNAMAPEAPKGARVIMLKRADAEPGDWVLVTDSLGQHYFREYRLVRPGQWVAHALNPAYLPLDSEVHGLRVLAIFDGMRGRRSRR